MGARQTTRPADEATPIDPAAHVAWRPAHEQLVLEAGADNGLRTVVVRPGIVYGGARGIVSDLLKDALNGLVRVVGPGKNHWPCVYDRDLADLYVRLLQAPEAAGIFHANDEADERVNDIVEAIARARAAAPRRALHADARSAAEDGCLRRRARARPARAQPARAGAGLGADAVEGDRQHPAAVRRVPRRTASGRGLTVGPPARAARYTGGMRTPLAAVLLCTLAACTPSTPPAPATAPPPSGPAEDEIREAPLEAHIRMLSHDLMEGRAPSTRGGTLAAEYLATQLAAMGLEPGGDNGTYFQQVPIVEATVNRSFTLSVPGRSYRYYDDVVAFSGTERAREHVQGEVVFVGHGIVAPELQWNDYAGVDVKGKWVLVMVNDPPAPGAAESGSVAGIATFTDADWSESRMSMPRSPSLASTKVRSPFRTPRKSVIVGRGSVHGLLPSEARTASIFSGSKIVVRSCGRSCEPCSSWIGMPSIRSR